MGRQFQEYKIRICPQVNLKMICQLCQTMVYEYVERQLCNVLRNVVSYDKPPLNIRFENDFIT